MKFKQSLIWFLLIISIKSDGQYIIVTGKVYYPYTSTQELHIAEQIRNPVDNTFKHVLNYTPKNSLFFKEIIKKDQPQLYQLTYGGKATKIYLAPNDSIDIDYIKLNKPDTVKSEFGYQTITTKLILRGNNMYQFNFFDSLETNTGAFIGNAIKVNSSLNGWENEYKDSVKLRFKKRVDYLNYFTRKYNLNKDFIDVAMIEIKSQYLSELIAAIYNQSKNKFDDNYFADIDNENITWEKYKKSNNYSAMVYSYVTHYLNWENINGIGKGTRNGSFANIYENIMLHLKDDSIRNFHLTFLMSQSLEKHPDNYEEYLEKYKHDCTNPEYISGIMKLHDNFMAKYDKSSFPLDVQIKTEFISLDKKSISLDKLLKSHKPTLFDFWASWCGPCLLEMPISKQFENEYINKINFVYISIDSKEASWSMAVKQNNLVGNQYLLKGERKSDFAKYLKLTYVPRFVLLDEHGKIIKFKGAESANKIAFRKMLDNFLNN